VVVLGFPSLIIHMVSVDVKNIELELRVQELCESRSRRPWLLSQEAATPEAARGSNLLSCIKLHGAATREDAVAATRESASE